MKINAENVWQFVRRNAVVILPVAGVAVQETQGLDWKHAWPILVGVFLRQKVTSPTVETNEKALDHYDTGFSVGLQAARIRSILSPPVDPSK